MCLEEGMYPGCLWPTVKAIKIGGECWADHSGLSIPLLAQFTMEDHGWYILGILDEVINLRQESLRWTVPRALDISPFPVFVSDVHDKVIYVGICD